MGRDSRGQATVETVAMLPLLVLVALTVGQVLAAHAAATLAAGAAEAGAVAPLQDRDPLGAARAPPRPRARRRAPGPGQRPPRPRRPRPPTGAPPPPAALAA